MTFLKLTGTGASVHEKERGMKGERERGNDWQIQCAGPTSVSLHDRTV